MNRFSTPEQFNRTVRPTVNSFGVDFSEVAESFQNSQRSFSSPGSRKTNLPRSNPVYRGAGAVVIQWFLSAEDFVLLESRIDNIPFFRECFFFFVSTSV